MQSLALLVILLMALSAIVTEGLSLGRGSLSMSGSKKKVSA